MTQASELIAQQMANANNVRKIWGDVIINVKEAPYNAKGDWNGTSGTNDTIAIQKAVNYANSIGKHDIWMPPGTYKYTTLSNTGNITFYGDYVNLVGDTFLEVVSFHSMADRIDNIVAGAGSSNTEIVDARLPATGGAYPTLKTRLDTENFNVVTSVNNEQAARIAADAAHAANPTAHNATAIVFTPGGSGIVSTNVDAAIKEQDARLDGHEASSTAHSASSIVFNPGTSGITATTVDAAIKEQDSRIDNLIVHGDSGPEAADARMSSPYGVTYPTLKDRVDHTDTVAIALKADVVQRGINVMSAPYNADPTGVTDSTAAIQAAINASYSGSQTEAKPTAQPRPFVYIPAGFFKITSSLMVPSGVRIVGAGKDLTVLSSVITNDSPVIYVKPLSSGQAFYNEISELTIEGNSLNCIGIKLENVSRWKIETVKINLTNREGLYLFEAYIGDVFNLLCRACGDATHSSIVHDGSDANHGTHAVTYSGGEIVGAALAVKTIKSGLLIKQGFSNALFGTTIQSFEGGYGIIEENGVSTTVQSCYFELNKGHILVMNAASSCYKNNFMTLTVAGALGFIVIDHLSGGEITGNLFKENVATLTNLAQVSGSSTMTATTVAGNTPTGYPIRIDAALNNPSVGNYISSFDGAFSNRISGRQGFDGNIEFFAALRGKQGLSQIGNATTAGAATHSTITGGTATPELVFTQPVGSLYLRYDGEWDTSGYLKARASRSGNTTRGWLPIQPVADFTTATRPVVTTIGFSIFDTTLGKPIWWNGSVWKDASGTTV